VYEYARGSEKGNPQLEVAGDTVGLYDRTGLSAQFAGVSVIEVMFFPAYLL
jgi:hypothetical protein